MKDQRKRNVARRPHKAAARHPRNPYRAKIKARRGLANGT